MHTMSTYRAACLCLFLALAACGGDGETFVDAADNADAAADVDATLDVDAALDVDAGVDAASTNVTVTVYVDGAVAGGIAVQVHDASGAFIATHTTGTD